jgi:hypothetical protein
VARFEPVPGAQRIVSEWLRWLDEGGRRPLRFFSEASRAYAERQQHDDRETALAVARKEFEREARDPIPAGESSDAYVALVTRGLEPLDAEFEERSRQFFVPLLAHREEGP